MSDDNFVRFDPRFWLTRFTESGAIGFWTFGRDLRQSPNILTHFDQWFEWCLAKHEGRLLVDGKVWKGTT